MAYKFSVLSWNVKHFNKSGQRMNDVFDVIENIPEGIPSIFAIYEVTGTMVYHEIVKKFPNHVFEITEGPQSQEILVGCHKDLHPFFTQKTEFKAGTTHMRPGLILSIQVNNVPYSLLFLHLASSQKPRGFGLRDDMLCKAVKLRKHFDKMSQTGDPARYIFLGDLNTMGMDYYKKANDIHFKDELEKVDDYASRYYDMKRLKNSYDYTYKGGGNSKLIGSLDHVYCTNNIQLRPFGNKNPGIHVGTEVDVRGWVDEPTLDKQKIWISDYSDHCYLYFEVL